MGLLQLLGIRGGQKLRDVRGAVRGPQTFQLVYENKRQPDGWGANRYAYELLQAIPFSPIDRAVRVRRQIIEPFQGPQLWVGYAVKINPIPSQSGEWYTGGMLQIDGSMPQLGTDSAIDLIAVAHNDPSGPVGANDPSIVWGPNDPSGEWA